MPLCVQGVVPAAEAAVVNRALGLVELNGEWADKRTDQLSGAPCVGCSVGVTIWGI